MMADLHFLRPWWLLALLPVVVLGLHWLTVSALPDPWAGIVARRLVPRVMVGGRGVIPRLPFALLFLGWTLCVLALAGPTWSRAPAVQWRPQVPPLVIVLDLSRSMDAVDVEPSRLHAARIAIVRLLERLPPREVGLVVFSEQAHTVLPLTQDVRLISALVPYLETRLMPALSSNPAAGLLRAFDMVHGAGRADGDILLVTDGDYGAAGAAKVAAQVRGRGVRTSVLAVGTAQGGLIPEGSGGGYLMREGRTVIPETDDDALREIAAAGDGAFATVGPDRRDTLSLLPAAALAQGDSGGPAESGSAEAVVWKDRGPLLILFLLPLAAVAFRRGWLGAMVLAVGLAGGRAHAFEWEALWLNPDQRAARLLAQGHAGPAARVFRDPFWKGIALYRDGDYEAAAQIFATLDSAAAHFNRGNALVHLERLDEALAAYAKALERDRGLGAARDNRDIVLEAKRDQAERRSRRLWPGSADGAGTASRPDDLDPYVEEFLAEKGGDHLLDEAGSRSSRHDIESNLGGGAMLIGSGAGAKGREGLGTGQSSRQGGAAQGQASGAARPGDSAGSTAGSELNTVRESGDPIDAGSPADDGETGQNRLSPDGEHTAVAAAADAPSAGRARESQSSAPSRGQASGGRGSGAGVEAGAHRPASGGQPRSAADEGQTPLAVGAGGNMGRGAGGGVMPEPSAALDPEARQALVQWLERIPDDPGGLLREIFRRDAQRAAKQSSGGPPW